MGYRELIAHLRKEGDEKIRQLWRDAENEAELIREETIKKEEDIKKQYKKKGARNAEEQEGRVISDAYRAAKAIRLSAQAVLSEKLFALSLSMLKELRHKKYKEVFTGLAREIPESEWSEVRVNPDDASLAEQHFPNVNISTNSNISGGMEVLENEGKTHIANTFEKRLEKGWQDILPLIIKDIYKELPDFETHSAP